MYLGIIIAANNRTPKYTLALATALAALLGPANTPARGDLSESFASCSILTDDTKRLACFDMLTAEIPEARSALEARAMTALQREFRFDPGLMTGPLAFRINVSGNEVVSRDTAAAREVESILRRVKRVIGSIDKWRVNIVVHGARVTLSRGRPYSAAELMAQVNVGIARAGLEAARYVAEQGSDAEPVLWDDGRVRSANENIEITISFGDAETR
ncbi:MAG: hypothetical protein CL573_07995 [Alphaproteobacteria bacterium]|nr:hypothetical protein [Alphaproteobacteria bacterium]HCP01478.1 hypothetical protein [Rhodospirillaceae bacterium]